MKKKIVSKVKKDKKNRVFEHSIHWSITPTKKKINPTKNYLFPCSNYIKNRLDYQEKLEVCYGKIKGS